MSTAQLKEIIDWRTTQERKGMTAYRLDKMFSVPELRQAVEKKKGAVCEFQTGSVLESRQFRMNLPYDGWVVCRHGMLKSSSSCLTLIRKLLVDSRNQ